MSDANRVNLAYVAESTYGVTPSGPPTLKDLRYVKESLSQETDSVVSEEVRADRQTVDVIRNNVNVGGDVDIEWSYSAYDDWLQYLLQSAGWSTLVTTTKTTVSAAAIDNSFNDSANGFVSAGYLVGQWIRVSGFANAVNNGYFKIATVSAGKITVTGGSLTVEAAGPSVTILMGAQIVNGTTFTSMSIERAYTDLASEFAILKGMGIDSFKLEMASDQIITGAWSLLGKSETSATATAGTGSNTAAPTKNVMNSIDDVVAILEAAASKSATGFSFEMSNNLRPRLQIASLGAVSVGSGSIDVKGSFTQYYATKAMMDKYLAFTATSLALVLDDNAGNGYVFDFPQVKFTSGKRVGGGKNTDVMGEMEFTAYRHATEGITVRIARFAGA